MIGLCRLAAATGQRVGDHATLDVAVLSRDHFDWLAGELTVERLHHHLAEVGAEQIRRFDLANLATLHFVIQDAFASFPQHWLLDGQGRWLAEHVLQLELPEPDYH